VFVTFEGIEGCGKSTQIERLARTLTEVGRVVTVTREPGGCALGRTLRAILLSTETRDLSDRAELFLYLADRAQHVATVIRPALENGGIVLCDRFVDSTVAYQGYGRGLDVALLTGLNDVAVADTMPARTILLDLDPAIGLARARARNAREGASVDEGRFEAEALAFHTRVRQGYLALAAAAPDRFVVLDAGRDIDTVAQDVLAAVRSGIQ